MGESRGIDEQVEADWRGFRRRLADRLERLDDDDWLRIEAEAGEGSTPFVQFAAFGDTIRAEAAGGALDARGVLPPQGQPRLDLCWNPPTASEPYLYVECPRREVDRLAVESVGVLRDLLGVVHPSFLDADGLEVDPAIRVLRTRTRPTTSTSATCPTRRRRTPCRVTTSATSSTRHCGRCSRSTRSSGTRTTTRPSGAASRWRSCGSAMIVRRSRSSPRSCSAPPTGRLSTELELLNQSHPYARFFARGEAVVMSHVLHTLPFVPQQFRLMVEAFLDEVDDVARTLATRLEGRRFFDPEPEPVPEPTLADLHPGLSDARAHARPHDDVRTAGSPVRPRPARRGRGDPGGSRRLGRRRRRDPALVLALLRKALRAVVDGEASRHRRRGTLPQKPRSRQDPLISDAEVGIDTLDLGRSA